MIANIILLILFTLIMLLAILYNIMNRRNEIKEEVKKFQTKDHFLAQWVDGKLHIVDFEIGCDDDTPYVYKTRFKSKKHIIHMVRLDFDPQFKREQKLKRIINED